MNIIHVNLASGFRGGERQTVLLIKELSKYSVQQAIVCQKDSPLRYYLADVPNLKFINSGFFLNGHFSNFKADLSHAHEAKAIYWCLIHKIIKKVPYVLTRRIDKPLKNKITTKIGYKNASARIAISKKIKKLLELKKFGAVKVIPSSKSNFKVDLNIKTQLRSKFKDKFIIGHVGALVDKHKGQRTLIDAIRIVNSSIKNIEFIFLGEGKDELELKKYSTDIKNIHWLGFKKNIADYIAALDLFVFPSRNEGLGSTLLDVIDCNIPIIATNVGGIPDIIINRETGILVPEGDSSLLAESIIELYHSSELRDSLTIKAKHHLTNFEPEKMSESYYSLYEQIIRSDNTSLIK